MKFTMRDKVCQLIGKYQFLEDDDTKEDTTHE